ncbi:MAG: hypothetical protein JW384_04318 [Nitrosomonadaceae bacterium]|nr:hypothetical protein [Nitrosomonadaceae bacterium]
MCIKTLKIAKDYPGANILMARATFPKLNDTLRKELFKWLPSNWKKSFSKQENVLELQNGTTINFRYIAQQGKSEESSTSNLLSATYDLVVVDQMEDPEITEKDFLDLLGRLRGMTRYIGDDPGMPRSGPRWMLLSCNPTRNWVYRSLVRPLHLHNAGISSADFKMYDKETGKSIIDLFEGSTYDNRRNLEEDFIKTLESAYHGQMRDRFLLGKWAAYEGLVYPTFDQDEHIISHERILNYLDLIKTQGVTPRPIEGYDHGLAVPSCYLFGVIDEPGNVFILDGFYEREQSIEAAANRIKAIREKHRDICVTFGQEDDWERIYSDPSLFRRTAGDKRTVGKSVSDLFSECGIRMCRGNNDIHGGIAKVAAFLEKRRMRRHPLTNELGSPSIFFSESLSFISAEFTDYYWKKDSQGEITDRPSDRNDHAMDTLKYLLSYFPDPAKVRRSVVAEAPWKTWHEVDAAEHRNKHRYG